MMGWHPVAALAFATLALASGAQAVTTSTDGTGQVLLYPYYSVRPTPTTGSANNTLVSIVNRTMRGKAVKLRVHEAKAGAPVHEMNVFVSLRDTWTAALVPSGAGAALFSLDHSCTVPTVRPGAGGELPDASR